MADEAKGKTTVNLEIDAALIERIQSAVKQLPPGWDMTRVFEVGAVQLLEKLAQKYAKGEPFTL
jgi:hypothetical protein